MIDYIIDINEQNCFITFNYDLFLDDAVVINNYKINYGLLGDYNLNFDSVENFPGYNRLLKGNRKPEDFDLLKLHGSLNWARCPSCNNITLSFRSNYKLILKHTCPRCKVRLVPILVPPTLKKNIDLYGIGSVWNRAEEMLSKADNLTIIGYSFPDADIEAKWLFKRALAKGGKVPILTLVEPKSEVREKIIKMFGNTVKDVIEYEKFEDYCEGRHL